MKPEKDRWIENVLASADNIQRAKADGTFYQKTMQRIKEETVVSSPYVLRIAAGLVLVIALNVFACTSFSKNKMNGGNAPLMAFAKEYSINNSSDNF